jgi:hypothetical protein
MSDVALAFLQPEPKEPLLAQQSPSVRPPGTPFRAWVFYGKTQSTEHATLSDDDLALAMSDFPKFVATKKLYGGERYIKLPGGGRFCVKVDDFHGCLSSPHGESKTAADFNSLFGPWRLETIVISVPIRVSK